MKELTWSIRTSTRNSFEKSHLQIFQYLFFLQGSLQAVNLDNEVLPKQTEQTGFFAIICIFIRNETTITHHCASLGMFAVSAETTSIIIFLTGEQIPPSFAGRLGNSSWRREEKLPAHFPTSQSDKMSPYFCPTNVYASRVIHPSNKFFTGRIHVYRHQELEISDAFFLGFDDELLDGTQQQNQHSTGTRTQFSTQICPGIIYRRGRTINAIQ